MTKQIRVENADLSPYPVRVIVEAKNQDGQWRPTEEHDLSTPTFMLPVFIHGSRRLVIEEASKGAPYQEPRAPFQLTPEALDAMVNRFLAWTLPDEFWPDCGISYNPIPGSKPTGTNLLTAEQAKAMLLHVLG